MQSLAIAGFYLMALESNPQNTAKVEKNKPHSYEWGYISLGFLFNKPALSA